MRATSSFRFQTDNARFGMNLLLMVLAVYWSVTLVFGSKAENVGSVIKVWVVAAGLVLAVKGWTLGLALADGARVFGQLRMPQRLWREWLRATLADSMRAWGILALGGTVLLMLPESPWRWSSAAAMYSAILCLGAIGALSNHGLVHRALAWTISAGVALYAILAALTIGLAHGLDIFGQSPAVVQGLLAISWPLLAYVVAIVWLRQSPIAPASYDRPRKGLWAGISAYARRYTSLSDAGRIRSASTSPTRAGFRALSSPFQKFAHVFSGRQLQVLGFNIARTHARDQGVQVSAGEFPLEGMGNACLSGCHTRLLRVVC